MNNLRVSQCSGPKITPGCDNHSSPMWLHKISCVCILQIEYTPGFMVSHVDINRARRSRNVGVDRHLSEDTMIDIWSREFLNCTVEKALVLSISPFFSDLLHVFDDEYLEVIIHALSCAPLRSPRIGFEIAGLAYHHGNAIYCPPNI